MAAWESSVYDSRFWLPFDGPIAAGAKGAASIRPWEWPGERYVLLHRLHAKAVIADDRYVLLTSANMTAAAYDLNIELRVLCRGGGWPHRFSVTSTP